jgi:hypothetical protein
MRVIVAGATGWTDVEAIRRELGRLAADSTIIHGDAAGADALAGQVAAELRLPVEAYRKEQEDFRRFKRGAWKGLNERMLASGADLVLAFHADLASSRGTRHLVDLARKAGVKVLVLAR